MVGNGMVRKATSGIKGGADIGTWSTTVGNGGAIETTDKTKVNASTGIRTWAFRDFEAKA
jgi:hypothetical protein